MKILQKNIQELQLQTTDYTCAAVAFLNSAMILGKNLPLDEFIIAEMLHCSITDGTSIEMMSNFMQTHFDNTDSGENTWDFETACIAIITDEKLDIGKRTHAALVFGTYNNSIVWYCSYFGKIYFTEREDFSLIWHSEDNKYINYSLNFQKSLIDFIIVDSLSNP